MCGINLLLVLINNDCVRGSATASTLLFRFRWSLSADSALDSLAAAESQMAGSFDTAKLEQDVAVLVQHLHEVLQ